jgi:hypothetical protein
MIEIDMAVTPPGLKGLNALAMRLEAMIAEKPKRETASAMPPGGGMGGMDY